MKIASFLSPCAILPAFYFKTFHRQTKNAEQSEIEGVWEDWEPEAFQIISWSNTASGRICTTAAGPVSGKQCIPTAACLKRMKRRRDAAVG